MRHGLQVNNFQKMSLLFTNSEKNLADFYTVKCPFAVTERTFRNLLTFSKKEFGKAVKFFISHNLLPFPSIRLYFHVKVLFELFAQMVNKSDFLKIINLCSALGFTHLGKNGLLRGVRHMLRLHI